MRKLIMYPLAACLMLALAGRMASYISEVNAADEVEPQFEDNFESLDPSWGEGKGYGVKDGKFFIELQPQKYQSVLNEANVFNEIDATVLVTTNQLDDPTKGDAGLVFWGQDNDNFHALMVTIDGRFCVERLSGGKRWSWPVDWKPADAIKKGIGETNELRVVTKEHNVTVYINGTQVATFKGQHPDGPSMVGMMAESWSKEPTRYEFAQLKVK